MGVTGSSRPPQWGIVTSSPINDRPATDWGEKIELVRHPSHRVTNGVHPRYSEYTNGATPTKKTSSWPEGDGWLDLSPPLAKRVPSRASSGEASPA